MERKYTIVWGGRLQDVPTLQHIADLHTADGAFHATTWQGEASVNIWPVVRF